MSKKTFNVYAIKKRFGVVGIKAPDKEEAKKLAHKAVENDDVSKIVWGKTETKIFDVELVKEDNE